jgi:hypothetical protein
MFERIYLFVLSEQGWPWGEGLFGASRFLDSGFRRNDSELAGCHGRNAVALTYLICTMVCIDDVPGFFRDSSNADICGDDFPQHNVGHA